MLVLSRKRSERILIGSDICITVVKLEGNQVRLGIDAPSDLEVPAGGSKIITASVGGTKEKDVDWLVECSGSACGKMTNDMYIAPIVRPNPPVVTLTAVSKADSTAKASITIHLVQAASQVPTKP